MPITVPIAVPIAVETTPTASIVMILSTVLTSSRSVFCLTRVVASTKLYQKTRRNQIEDRNITADGREFTLGFAHIEKSLAVDKKQSV